MAYGHFKHSISMLVKLSWTWNLNLQAILSINCSSLFFNISQIPLLMPFANARKNCMAINKRIPVEVAYATPNKQMVLRIFVDEGSTIQETILQSEIQTYFPEINLTQQKVGIFNHC